MPNLPEIPVVKIPGFRPWVHKVMPGVYDDTLSYYELLAKVVGYLNQMNDQQNEIIDWMEKVVGEQNADIEMLKKAFITFRGDMVKAFEEFKKDVTDSLLGDKVGEILKEWLEDGKLADIINKDVFDMKADKEYVDEELKKVRDDVDETVKEVEEALDKISQSKSTVTYKTVSLTITNNSKDDGYYNDIFDVLKRDNASCVLVILANMPDGFKGHTFDRIAEEKIQRVIDLAKAKDVKIDMIKPHKVENWSDSSNRVNVNPDDLNLHFSNWTNELLYYSAIAGKNGIPYLCISCEEEKLTNGNQALWEMMTSSLKQQNPDIKLTSALTYIEMGKAIDLAKLNQKHQITYLDIIGCNLYNSLSTAVVTSPTQVNIEDLNRAWAYSNSKQKYEGYMALLNGFYGKDIFITELGAMHYADALVSNVTDMTTDWTNKELWSFVAVGLYYKSLFNTIGNMPYVKGVSVWGTDLTYIYWADTGTSYAEQVIKDYYGGIL